MSNQIFERWNEPEDPIAPETPPSNSTSELRQSEMISAEMIAKRIDTHMMTSSGTNLTEGEKADIERYANTILDTSQDSRFSFITRNYDSEEESVVMLRMTSGDTYIFTFSGEPSKRIMNPRSEIPWAENSKPVLRGR